MELPHIGKHCSQDDCRQLDFLPVKCDGCSKVFCGDHYSYAGHNCPGAYRKNVQVPVCPLCNAPIPGKVSELPDIRVSRHIDADCKSDTAMTRRNKVYTNKCSHKGCKQKEMIPILCDQCNLNYCLKHRHTADHNCSKASEKPLSKGAAAAMSRSKSSSSNSTSTSHNHNSHLQSARNSIGATASSFSNGLGRFLGYGQAPSTQASVQGNMTEDEALQLALQASLAESSSNTNSGRDTSQEHEDFLLAKAIAESEREANTTGTAGRQSRNRHPSCKVS